MNQQNATLVITGEVRISYSHLTQPFANQPNQEPKFSATLLIPKSDVATRQRIDAAIAVAIEEGVKNKWNGMRPPQPAVPIHDGDGVRQNNGLPFSAECKGHLVLTASSKQRPEIINLDMQPILDPTQIYSGMYARVSIRFFPYNNNGKWGIGCGLNNVQKLRDGEPLGGRTTAAEDFGAPASPMPAQAPGYAPGYPAPPQTPAAYSAPPQYPQTPPAIPPAAPQYQPPAPGYVPGYPAAPAPAAYAPMQQSGAAYPPPAAYPGGVNPITGQPNTGPVLGIN